MCGICGIYRMDGREADAVVVRAMAEAQRHRGPDDDGFLFDGALGMGMRRLSIIDTEGGKQPIYNENRTVAAIQNGELYNFQEITQTLKSQGHEFSTRCDTEIIAHLYEQHGPEFISRVRGMFGIAVWDFVKKELFLYRDRLGIKPLYYYQDGPLFAFSSEIKSFFRMPGFSREIDPEGLELYLTYGYIPGPRSIFSKVRKLLPGCRMSVGSGGARIEKYWRFDFTTGPRKTEDEYAGELRDIFKETVRLHLISDVPLGVFLSGGVDSSTLVALMRELGVNPIKSYSVGFSEKSYSEIEYARRVAKKFDTVHHEMIVDEKHLDILPKMVKGFDEPFADSSAVPMYLISRFARQGVTVALSGEGGDETFAGYHTYTATKVASLARMFPFSAGVKMLKTLVPMLPTSFEKVSLDYKLKKFTEHITGDPIRSHLQWKTIFSSGERDRLLMRTSGAAPKAGDFEKHIAEVFDNREGWDNLSLALWLDSVSFLPDDLLVKNDRMSMANSLEARVPFLDHVLVEYVSRMPSDMKMRVFNKKYILKKIMRDKLGSEIVDRKKAGFNIPLPKWILADEAGRFGKVFGEQLDALDFPMDREFAAELVSQHQSGKRDNSRTLWTLLNFILWHNCCVSGLSID